MVCFHLGKKKNNVFVQGLNPRQQRERGKAIRDFQKNRVTAMTVKRTVWNLYRVLSTAVKAVGAEVKGNGALLSSTTVAVVFIIVIVVFRNGESMSQRRSIGRYTVNH